MSCLKSVLDSLKIGYRSYGEKNSGELYVKILKLCGHTEKFAKNSLMSIRTDGGTRYLGFVGSQHDVKQLRGELKRVDIERHLIAPAVEAVMAKNIAHNALVLQAFINRGTINSLKEFDALVARPCLNHVAKSIIRDCRLSLVTNLKQMKREIQVAKRSEGKPFNEIGAPNDGSYTIGEFDSYHGVVTASAHRY